MFASQRCQSNWMSWAEVRTGIYMAIGLPLPLPDECERCHHKLGPQAHRHVRSCPKIRNGYAHKRLMLGIRRGFGAIGAPLNPGETVLWGRHGWHPRNGRHYKDLKHRGDGTLPLFGQEFVLDACLTDNMEALTWYSKPGEAADHYETNVKKKEYAGWIDFQQQLRICCVEMFGGVNESFIKFIDMVCEKVLKDEDKYKKRFIREAISVERVKGVAWAVRRMCEGSDDDNVAVPLRDEYLATAP